MLFKKRDIKARCRTTIEVTSNYVMQGVRGEIQGEGQRGEGLGRGESQRGGEGKGRREGRGGEGRGDGRGYRETELGRIKTDREG